MSMSQLLVFVCILPFAVGTLAEPHSLPSFASFVAEYGRSYTNSSKEYEMRRGIYEQRLTQAREHNDRAQRRWNAAVNQLSDRTEPELAQLRGLRVVKSTGKRGRGVVGAHKGQFLSQVRNAVVPDAKSWEHLDAMKLDFNQGACGSCWAVATATMLVANAEISGHNRSFSAQELVSCVPNPHSCGGDGGCQGATVELGMNWVMEKGLATEERTPYLGSDGTCEKTSDGTALFSSAGVDAGDAHLQAMIAVGFHGALSPQSPGLMLGIQGWERLPENEYEPLIRAVAERGPVAVSVAASGWSSYGAGVFDGCGKDAVIDHAVTLVGYGKDDKGNKDKYWTLKNSWGLTWGENGQIRLLREEGNVHCGTDYQPEVGTACKGGPSSVPVCGMCGILYDAVVPHFSKA